MPWLDSQSVKELFCLGTQIFALQVGSVGAGLLLTALLRQLLCVAINVWVVLTELAARALSNHVCLGSDSALLSLVCQDESVHRVLTDVVDELLTVLIDIHRCSHCRLALACAISQALEQVFLLVEWLPYICSVNICKHRVEGVFYLAFKGFGVSALVLVELGLEVLRHLLAVDNLIVVLDLRLEIGVDAVLEPACRELFLAQTVIVIAGGSSLV